MQILLQWTMTSARTCLSLLIWREKSAAALVKMEEGTQEEISPLF